MQTSQSRSYLAVILIVAGVSAVAMAALFLLPIIHMPFPKAENFYVIYYGHLVDEDGEMTKQVSRIIAAKPEMVIVSYSLPDGELNLTPKVHKLLEDNGIKVLTYTWTDYGKRDIVEVKADIGRQIKSGVDGIFVDEVTNIETNQEYGYYSAIYHNVKSYGEDKVVVMNPGHYKVTERIVSISDIVSLEEEWMYQDKIPWKSKYPPAEFMGVSSNEYCVLCVDESNAAGKTIEAWDGGIGYHFATDKYIDLPSWFDGYAGQIKTERTNTTQ